MSQTHDHGAPATDPPPSFTDTLGRRWVVDVTARTMKRVRQLTGVNLYELVDPRSGLSLKLGADPSLLVDVIYAACQPQADRLELTDEEFAEALWGDAFAAAADAMTRAVLRFTPDPKRRRVLREIYEASQAETERTLAEGVSAADRGEIREATRRAMAAIGSPPSEPSGASSNAPASSASSPGA